jgi:thiol-disulfide isomerase/thioredoxin
MKKTLVVILGVILSISLYAQNNEKYLSAKFISGCPKDIEPIKNQLGLKNLSYANLETGIDSIKIVFGKLIQGNTNGYWISSYFNNNLTSFSTASLIKDKSSEYLSNNIDIKLDNSSKKISLYVKHDPNTNEVLYSWLAGEKRQNELTIQKIEKPLDKNKTLPEFNLTTLTDKNIISTDFRGKFLVINWWATTCAPCRQEIPGLNKLTDKFGSNSNIIFLAIAFDEKDRVESYLKTNEFNYLQTLGDKSIAKIFGESYPKNLIVNPEGIITFYSEGGNEDIYKILEKELLKQMN